MQDVPVFSYNYSHDLPISPNFTILSRHITVDKYFQVLPILQIIYDNKVKYKWGGYSSFFRQTIALIMI